MERLDDSTDPRMFYTPEWVCDVSAAEYNHSTHGPMTGGAQITFQFKGTKMDVYGMISGNKFAFQHMSPFTIDSGEPVWSPSPPELTQYNQGIFGSPTFQDGTRVLTVIVNQSLTYVDYLKCMPSGSQGASSVLLLPSKWVIFKAYEARRDLSSVPPPSSLLQPSVSSHRSSSSGRPSLSSSSHSSSSSHRSSSLHSSSSSHRTSSTSKPSLRSSLHLSQSSHRPSSSAGVITTTSFVATPIQSITSAGTGSDSSSNSPSSDVPLRIFVYISIVSAVVVISVVGALTWQYLRRKRRRTGRPKSIYRDSEPGVTITPFYMTPATRKLSSELVLSP
ncbi:hypothetical protein L218DRAFT_1003857 [Marasmius fiardii PR-910]|nr:hypothetical protein L218DRAFT_1003857 [Marasmius fiardii PR-910]